MKIILPIFFIFLFFSMKIVFAENLINLERSAWTYIADNVMGGISKGRIDVKKKDNERFYKLQGQVSTKNNGGFLQFRT